MRKFLSLLIIPILVCSCLNDIDYSADEVEDALLMNANFSTLDTHHSVYLGLSKYNVLEKIDAATVDCYLNGSKIASISQKDSVNSYLQSVYSFDAQFKEGDEVTLVAKSGEYNATTSATFPVGANMELIDTLWMSVELVVMDTLLHFDLFDLDANIIDPKHDDTRFYALELFYRYSADTVAADGSLVHVDDGVKLMQSMYFDQYMFSGDTLTTPFLSDASKFKYPGKVVADSLVENVTLDLQLAVIPQEYFHFLQTTGVFASNGSTVDMFKDIIYSQMGETVSGMGDMMMSTYTDLPLAGNVDGAYGFFGVRTSYSIILDQMQKTYSRKDLVGEEEESEESEETGQ